ncbi:hypothetical protein C5167_020702 [Papaver somniferum]|uniref:Uncharacterized protein n=1 Tax=Papaver somniferum TaxID=3469 RepID=A0A4Y7IXR7_PAPSO|nr:uncharacterized protein LOC113350032 isoform X2 [Papaver somniferum]RZC52279.1 hypothetical protein C5167_020702 [Papaver somniferum]
MARRSPRIIARQSQQQRDAELQWLSEKRDSMTEVEKQTLREKYHNAYLIRKAKIRCGNTAETSNQGLPVSDLAGEHKAESSFILSPKIELLRRELQLEKHRTAMRERRSSMTENEKHQFLEKARSSMKERRSLVTGNDKQLILEQLRRAYEIRRIRVGEGTNNEHTAGPSSERNDVPVMNLSRSPRLIEQGQAQRQHVQGSDIRLPRRSPRIVEQVNQIREDHATEASRKRKGKEVAHDKQKQSRANSYVPDRNTLEGLVTRCEVADQVITRQSPRLLEQVQLQDELTAEESRKRKGKAVAVYQVLLLLSSDFKSNTPHLNRHRMR